jgi:tetratricopeptide (TPR) repeat protein
MLISETSRATTLDTKQDASVIFLTARQYPLTFVKTGKQYFKIFPDLLLFLLPRYNILKSMSDTPVIRKYLNIWIMLGIVLLTILIYSNSIGNGFVDFDDTENVVDNVSIREFNLRNITHYFTTPLQFMYTPLVFVSYAIDYQIGKTSPWIYHTTNLFLHICNILLVFWIFKKYTKQNFIALFIAFIFAIHPVNVDGISWISTRSNLLATFFYLGALAIYTHYMESGKLWQLLLSVFVFLLATFSKSAAVVFFVTLLLWDYFAGRKLYTKKTGWRNLLEKIPFLAISIIMGIVALNFRVDEYHLYQYNLLDRFFVICASIVGYFFKLLFPFGLAFTYAYPLKTGAFLPWYVYLIPVVLCLVVWGLNKLKVPKKVLIFGFGFFLLNIILTQIPVLIDNFQANRYAYLSYLGLYFILAWSMNTLVTSTKGWVSKLKIVWKGILVITIALFAFLTYSRNFLWKDTVALLSNSITNQKDVPFTYSNRGITKYKNGDYEGALADFNKSISLDPGFTLAYNYRGLVKDKLGDKDGAMADLNRAIEYVPDFPDAYCNRGSLKRELQDYAGALSDFTRAIQLNSYYVDALFNRGLLYIDIGDYEAAIRDYNTVIRYSPDYANAYNNRGIASICLGDNQNAVRDFDKALSLNPQFADAYYNRGLAKSNLGDTAGACADWKQAASYGFQRANKLIDKRCN